MPCCSATICAATRRQQQAYGEFKRQAAALPIDSVGDYTDLKDPVCDLIYLPAEEWAARTGWTP